MALSPVNIYDVPTEKYAYSLTGELGTTGLSPCVAVIVIFSDHTIMMEHRSDIELYKYGSEAEVLDLLEDIAKKVEYPVSEFLIMNIGSNISPPHQKTCHIWSEPVGKS
ncbi:unnamed protein product [Adineta steineri]|uniref:Uncharacterized protein n=1 Tax=Adineta steineri TaxID=433720 RepID=A0A815CZN2_9BILA|nr:unnamed protein product [Adineta steineri]CAF4313112.1 unnamed protein product [Adineta steineri]